MIGRRRKEFRLFDEPPAALRWRRVQRVIIGVGWALIGTYTFFAFSFGGPYRESRPLLVGCGVVLVVVVLGTERLIAVARTRAWQRAMPKPAIADPLALPPSPAGSTDSEGPPPDIPRQPAPVKEEVRTEVRAQVPATAFAEPARLEQLAPPLVVGPTYELDRAVVRLPRRVVTGARYESCFFGGLTSGGAFEVRGASLRGFGHVEDDTSGQDTIGAVWLPARQSLVAVVADGLGGEAGSEQVSQRATEHVLDLAGHSPMSMRELLTAARGRLLGDEFARGSTTLAAVEVTARRDGAEVRLGAVGDSEVWLLDRGEWHAVYHDRHPDGTRALPAWKQIEERAFVIQRGAVLVLASDGFALELDDGRSMLAAELARLWKVAPSPLAFTGHVDFRDEDRLDDRGVVAIWVRDG